MPYRTLDDRIDGVVITFADITAAKTLEAQLREKHDLLEKHVAQQSKKTEHSAGKAPVKTTGSIRSADASGKPPATGKI
jgi:two-component system CheB/CheR fusion protein